MKKILLLFLLCFAVNGYSDVSNYQVGDVYESKKRTTSVVLYKFKAHLLISQTTSELFVEFNSLLLHAKVNEVETM